jgi:catechol 2,3-dioxygenase-like lactoylglutathione lyase family enzyme
MIRQIVPQFFTTDIAATLAYYKDKLGFDCLARGKIRQSTPCYARPPRDSLPLRRAAHSQSK